MTDLAIEQIRPELTWRLRRDVLYPGKNMHEMEMEEDNDGFHFGAFKNNNLVGVVSVFQIGEDFQFRKLAIDRLCQKQGIGSAVMKYIIDFVKTNGGKRLWCNARVEAIDFYLKRGFSVTGEKFSRDGIDYEIIEKALTE
ncbi:N-acetyltransferase [Mucilaginibacter hurinus]|uniref:N-acetyltransferase n=1 Tax=Mucilaginibacter hurinus TaxID=2201324 RepID=A0A367GPK0_9SPHI|nr:GNAT family N-acetyltransferase [Mucilaginibacter hurinus]RCH54995.1 N-acetyltransferase [Mucilaginibacter hurinus]